MPEEIGTIYLRAVITNRRAVNALLEAIELVDEAAEDMTWRDDLQEAIGLLREATRGLEGLIVEEPT